MVDMSLNEIQRSVESLSFANNNKEVFLIFINEEFDFTSNFFLADTYLSLNTLVCNNEQLI